MPVATESHPVHPSDTRERSQVSTASDEKITKTEALASVFISYGGPDEPFALKLNKALQLSGVTTFLFKAHAVPGQKLHRVMSQNVNKFDRVVLICSASSLNRPGVQNELEEVLAREAREGGAEILIPIMPSTTTFSAIGLRHDANWLGLYGIEWSLTFGARMTTRESSRKASSACLKRSRVVDSGGSHTTADTPGSLGPRVCQADRLANDDPGRAVMAEPNSTPGASSPRGADSLSMNTTFFWLVHSSATRR